MRKPDNIKYWLDDKPPLQITLLLALQQMSFLAVYLVVSPLFAHTLNLSHLQSLQLISGTLLASAIGVLLQAWGRWGIGSGFFCPLQATSSTFGALVMAKAIGGVGAIFGNFLSGALRNPSAADGQFGRAFIGAALAEGLGIFAFVVALILLFVVK